MAAAPDSASAQAAPKLSLIAATNSLTLDSWKEDPGVYLDLGTYLTAEGGPFELKVTRKSYKDPIVVKQLIQDGDKTTSKTLPAGLVKDFSGLPDFAQISVTDTNRKVVVKKSEVLPQQRHAAGSTRTARESRSTRRAARRTRSRSVRCGAWRRAGRPTRTPVSTPSRSSSPCGKYTAKVTVNKKYRDLFGISSKPQIIKLTVRERSWEDENGGGVGMRAKGADHSGHDMSAMKGMEGHGSMRPKAPAAPTSGAVPSYNVGHGPLIPAPPALPWALKKSSLRSAVAPVGDGPGRTDGSRQAPGAEPNAKRPTGKASVPDVPKPDLRSL